MVVRVAVVRQDITLKKLRRLDSIVIVMPSELKLPNNHQLVI